MNSETSETSEFPTTSVYQANPTFMSNNTSSQTNLTIEDDILARVLALSALTDPYPNDNKRDNNLATNLNNTADNKKRHRDDNDDDIVVDDITERITVTSCYDTNNDLISRTVIIKPTNSASVASDVNSSNTTSTTSNVSDFVINNPNRFNKSNRSIRPHISKKHVVVDPNLSAALKKSATETFASMCLKSIDAISYYYDNEHLIDVHHNDDEPFRNACMANNTFLAQFIHAIGKVNIHSRNNQSFHVTCLNQNVELATWFTKLDSRYSFTLLPCGKIDIETCGFKSDEVKQPVISIIIDDTFDDTFNDNFNDTFDDELINFDNTFDGEPTDSVISDFDQLDMEEIDQLVMKEIDQLDMEISEPDSFS